MLDLRPWRALEKKIRLLLADDHPDILEEIGNLLMREFDVIGTVRDGISLIQAARDLGPDVVVTDIKMPMLSGIEASRRILDLRLCKAVIASTMYKDAQLVSTAMNAGISAYVLKESAGEELIPAVTAVLRGRVFVSKGIDSG
ncbi:MAG: response regulator transcription factor [Acidobacteriaceae bacterium]|nr:response regulator transcription factor [Acidobacteriaceae bacterium]